MTNKTIKDLRKKNPCGLVTLEAPLSALLDEYVIITPIAAPLSNTFMPSTDAGLIRRSAPDKKLVDSIKTDGWLTTSPGVLLPMLDPDEFKNFSAAMTAAVKNKDPMTAEKKRDFWRGWFNPGHIENMQSLVVDGANRRSAMLLNADHHNEPDTYKPSIFVGSLLDPLTPLDVIFQIAFLQNKSATAVTVESFMDKLTGNVSTLDGHKK